MTCIAAFVTKDKEVWMGGDSAGSDGYSLVIRADKKVFRNGPFLMGQILRYDFKPPKHPKGMGVDRYMVKVFIKAVRKALEDGGYAKKVHGCERGGNFLVGYRGRLFNIESDYQVGESAHGFDSVGCGYDLALGALYATPDMAPRKRMTLALKAASAFSAGVCGPYTIKVQKP